MITGKFEFKYKYLIASLNYIKNFSKSKGLLKE